MSSSSPVLIRPLPPHPALDDYYRGAKHDFVRRIFDQGAADYDRVERMMALGSGSWYRRQALWRAGLREGMKVLDVAIGTGLVAREELGIVGQRGQVIGIDPSSGMLAQARQSLTIPVIMGIGEQLPLADCSFDFVSMGYALRHVADINTVFVQYHRVLRPGGRLCVLELTRPRGRIRNALLRLYMRTIIPRLTRLLTRRTQSQLLWQYYWDTIESCISPQQVLSAIERAGFTEIGHMRELGLFSEYTAVKPLG
jgi:demethylmenaquinone methyltransferase / 2-methoxy-6-polyprenyl-1,4-benzoquinol methylase